MYSGSVCTKLSPSATSLAFSLLLQHKIAKKRDVFQFLPRFTRARWGARRVCTKFAIFEIDDSNCEDSIRINFGALDGNFLKWYCAVLSSLYCFLRAECNVLYQVVLLKLWNSVVRSFFILIVYSVHWKIYSEDLKIFSVNWKIYSATGWSTQLIDALLQCLS